MEIIVLRTISYLYYLIGVILFGVVAIYVYLKRTDRKLVQIFLLGLIVGVGFELTMGLTGQRNLYIEESHNGTL